MTKIYSPIVLDEDLVARFWTKVNVGNEDDCWEWQAATTSGYGVIGLTKGKGKTVLAHRLSYVIHNGEIDNTLLIRHECDNPPCVNPKHLIQGTDLDNAQDMMKRGRYTPHGKIGSTNPASKLNEEKVVFIRSNHPRIPTRQLAAMFDVDRTLIQQIIARKAWKHV